MEERKLSDLIDSAIQREGEAFRFYMELNEKIEDKSVKDTLTWIAEEEKKHKQFLVDYRDGRYATGNLPERDVKYYAIAEHQDEPEIKTDMKHVKQYGQLRMRVSENRKMGELFTRYKDLLVIRIKATTL